MKNVTITLEENVARWAKIWAAKNDTSMSRMLGETLREKMLLEQSYEQAHKDFFAREPRPLKSTRAKYPTRDKTHER